MGFEANLSYNLPRIDTLSHGGFTESLLTQSLFATFENFFSKAL